MTDYKSRDESSEPEEEFLGAAGAESTFPPETVAQFAERHRLPVNVVRELNRDKFDEYGHQTGTLEIPDGSN